MKLVGPGFVCQLSGSETKWVKIGLGNTGEMLSSELVNVAGVPLPYEAPEAIRAGDRVRISGFLEAKVEVIRDSVQAREYACQKCGHINTIS